MSGEQQASSFGDPNAQPPTPKQTPITAALPSPVFETPKNQQGLFTGHETWTPRFAEEFSVFNNTPGNLQAAQGTFSGLVPLTPSFHPTPSSGHKRHLSAGGIAAEIATHATHFSPNPGLSLPPVHPSQRLPSSPTPLNGNQEFSEEEEEDIPPASQKTKAPKGSAQKGKKKKNKGGGREPATQTATPPPSSHKGRRKLAPKPQADVMQTDQAFGEPDFTVGTPTQTSNIGGPFTSPSDVFGYPMSAPAAAPASFWDPNVDMSGMDLDFSSFNSAIFQTPTPINHRQMSSFDAGQMFQEPEAQPQLERRLEKQPEKSRQAQAGRQTKSARKERPLAPKVTSQPEASAPVPISAMPSSAFTTSVDDPFGIVSPSSGVDPGLLFSRPQSSSNMDSGFAALQPDLAQQLPVAQVAQVLTTAPRRGDIRRSLSTKELSASRLPDRASASSPIKSSGRPGLQRSFSENRGRRKLARGPLPGVAPASRPTMASSGGVAGAGGAGTGAGIRAPNLKGSGRISPLKHHHGLSSLSSIPEAASPRTRTSVKFTIDAHGRARAETTVLLDGSSIRSGSGSERRGSQDMTKRERGFESDDDDDSSTDDEPIIIPSRNTSFALPDPRKPTPAGYHTSQRSISERSTSSHATGYSGDTMGNDPESEAETVMNEPRDESGNGHGGCDAANELRRVMQSRQKRPQQLPGSAQRPQRFLSGSNFGGFPGPAPSPTTISEVSLLTPTTDARGRGVRCVCNRASNGDRESGGYMVQCESCEMWLHGECIGITSKRVLPSVYICAFCANTPNMRGGRLRDTGRGSMYGPGPASPLAHKSFKSFR